MSDGRDRLYREPRSDVEAFVFDEQVAAVFPDMIRRSVPGYGTVIAMTGVIAAHYYQPGTTIYDLGCSQGASVLSIARQLDKPAAMIAVDNSQAMLDLCHGHDYPASVAVDFVCADMREVAIRNASVVVMNYTLQFIPVAERDAMIRRIAEGMVPGGVLLLSEKLAVQDALFTQLHHAFKQANGYSELEVSQKRTALENILVPEPPQVHLERLKQAGFGRAEQWFHCLNFGSFLAIRS
ncbi:MAG: carboxy-S-adenosyl-L-methionine synthase CmoA [Gammaproteobacteria bacterium]|jgi:tRNA (cmo5U34)-methyltransferase